MSRQISNHESESFDLYLQEIGRMPALSEDAEKTLFERIAKGDERARDQVVTANLRLVVSVARQYRDKGVDFTDLVNEGNVGLVQAVDKYDISRGTSFASFASWYIREAMQNAIAEQSRIVRVPSGQVDQLNRINRLRALFEQEHERRPNVNEIASTASVTERKVMETMSASARQCSVDAPFSDSNPSSLADLLSDAEAAPTDHSVLLDAMRLELQRVISMLNDRERNVVRAFYGINEPQLTFAEIGERYNMSRERARQIRKKALRHIRSMTGNSALRSFLKM